MGQVGVHFQAHVTVFPTGLAVNRLKQISCGANIFYSQFPKNIGTGPTGISHRFQTGIIIIRFGNGILKNTRVGGYTIDLAVVDHFSHIAIS
ncbi:hypothetical protein SDC9_68764 [bioreactor metagenome]|uniref:Uncharacterized protein n=1 Tax=bioreactor metagenome TaxID=1076179 RepID=A0A644Y1B2_9ZZZZ